MVNKLRRKQQKSKKSTVQVQQQHAAPPPPPPSENNDDSNKKQQQTLSKKQQEELSSSPHKVLVTSSKHNFSNIRSAPLKNPKRSVSPRTTTKAATTEDHDDDDDEISFSLSLDAQKEIKKAMKRYDENLKKHVTASGALDLEGIINAGMKDDGNNNGSASKLVVIPVEPGKMHVVEVEEENPPNSVAAASAARKESFDSSGTDTALEDYDWSISGIPLPTTTVEESNPEQVQSSIKLDRSPVLFSEDNSNSEHSSQTSTTTATTASDGEETPKEQLEEPEIESRPLDPRRRTYSVNRKRFNNNNNSSNSNNATTLLKPSSYELATTTTTTLEPERRNVELKHLHLVQEAMKQQFQIICIAEKCKKPASVCCPSCKKLVWCTEKHRKISKKEHEPSCSSFRQIENKSLGIQTIAARDIKRARPVLSDEPAMMLPLNPSLESRTFPNTYCLNCFTSDGKADSSSISKTAACTGCHLPLCGDKQCLPPRVFRSVKCSYLDLAPHVDACKILSSTVKRVTVDKQYFLILDQSLVGLLRCLMLPNNKSNDDTAPFLDLMNRVKLEPHTENFKSKMQLIRDLILVDRSVLSDDQLYQLDHALTRYGRNIGPDTVTHMDSATSRLTYVRCFFPTLVHISHSCVPNCVVVVNQDLMVQTHSVKDVKKGEVFTICYDERVLFSPTVVRRRYLFREFGILCRCKRCSCPTEMNTYFSSYPCSRCNGYLNPENPLDDYTNWLCYKCKKTPVFYLRVIDVNLNFEGELEKPIRERDVFGLLALITELVTEKFLHWNHHIIFHACIKLFCILWKGFEEKDTKVTDEFSKVKGLQFVKPAETVLNITQAFVPDGYPFGFLLAIRLAALIKLRHLTEQLRRKDISLTKLNWAVNEMYYRGYDIVKSPLYDRVDIRNTANSKASDLSLKFLEKNVIIDLVSGVIDEQGLAVSSTTADAVYKMYNKKLYDEEYRQAMIDGDGRNDIFTWEISA